MTCGQAAQVMAHDSVPAATLVGKGGFCYFPCRRGGGMIHFWGDFSFPFSNRYSEATRIVTFWRQLRFCAGFPLILTENHCIMSEQLDNE